MTQKWTIRDLADIAIVAAIYVVLSISPGLNAISYGVVQIRLAEILNFLPFYNKKYIVAVTLGCLIANTGSPYGWIDMVVGTLQTLIGVSIGVALFGRLKKHTLLGGMTNMAFLMFVPFFAASMIIIALEQAYIGALGGTPLFIVWGMLFISESITLLIGAFLLPYLARYIDLTR